MPSRSTLEIDLCKARNRTMATQTAPAMPLTEKDRIQIINQIKQLITDRHINVSNPNQDYKAWVALADQRSASLVRVADDQEFERGIGELLNALGSSHTAFF